MKKKLEDIFDEFSGRVGEISRNDGKIFRKCSNYPREQNHLFRVQTLKKLENFIDFPSFFSFCFPTGP